jgi:hypothetical protein
MNLEGIDGVDYTRPPERIKGEFTTIVVEMFQKRTR